MNFQHFLTAIRPTRHPGQRAMYFVHVLMPHQPWHYLPSGARYPERTLGEGRFAKAGRKVADLEAGPPAGTARVVGLDEYRHVDPTSGTVPAQVAGRLTKLAPGVPARPPVVAAINGVVGGVSETFASPGGTPPTWFTAMIPRQPDAQGRQPPPALPAGLCRRRAAAAPLTLTR